MMRQCRVVQVHCPVTFAITRLARVIVHIKTGCLQPVHCIDGNIT